MKVVDTPDALTLSGTVIAIGNFDGVHLGHQFLLAELQRLATELSAPSVIITFFPPTKVVFGRGYYLSSREEKLELLARFGPHAVVVVPFDLAYAQTDKRHFMAQLTRLHPRAIIVGDDFRFGHKREGTLNDLSQLVERLEVFGMKRVDGEAVKSSRIRKLLSEGAIEAANRLLGYPYMASGRVVKGAQRGRAIGFPTANVQVDKHKALPTGVFAVRAKTPQRDFGGMANVGPRPSFEDEAPSLEVHLFDFAESLYDQELRVEFVGFLRSQQKFDGLDALKAQLQEDARRARTLLGDI